MANKSLDKAILSNLLNGRIVLDGKMQGVIKAVSFQGLEVEWENGKKEFLKKNMLHQYTLKGRNVETVKPEQKKAPAAVQPPPKVKSNPLVDKGLNKFLDI